MLQVSSLYVMHRYYVGTGGGGGGTCPQIFGLARTNSGVSRNINRHKFWACASPLKKFIPTQTHTMHYTCTLQTQNFVHTNIHVHTHKLTYHSLADLCAQDIPVHAGCLLQVRHCNCNMIEPSNPPGSRICRAGTGI